MPLLLCFTRRDVPLTVTLTLVTHGRLWAAFDFVRPLGALANVFKYALPYYSRALPPPEPEPEERPLPEAIVASPPPPVDDPWWALGDLPLPPVTDSEDTIMDVARYLM